MTLGILTTITEPEKRQDKWLEALDCYTDLADQVVVVDGHDWYDEKNKKEVGLDHHALFTAKFPHKHHKVRWCYLEWPKEWNWIELPRHLNQGLDWLQTDWCLKLDIDQLIHERHFDEIRQKLADYPQDCYAVTMQKMSFTYSKKYFQKGEQTICLRNLPFIRFGKNLEKETDLCFPIQQTGVEEVIYKWDLSSGYNHGGDKIYELPIGKPLKQFKTGVKYFNYDYYFKTKEFTKKEFWRFSRAYHRYFKSWRFGDSEENAFKVFLNLAKSRYDKSPYIEDENTHPKWMKGAIQNLTKEQFGYNGWGENFVENDSSRT